MPTRLDNIVVDSADPAALGRFWAELLDWPIETHDDEVDVHAPAEDGSTIDIVFVPVSEPKTGKNRLHIELSSASPDQQVVLVDRALALGARRVDIGQRNVSWIVLADPEGNEFCVLEPRPEYATAGAIAAVVVDSRDPAALAAFWSVAAGWPVARSAEEGASLRPPDGRGLWLEFVRVDEPKRVKNRVHLDVRPFAGDDQGAEVTELVDLGASMANVGQGDVPWSVLTDPEGNEFCVLTPR
jgi:hypothetical protein